MRKFKGRNNKGKICIITKNTILGKLFAMHRTKDSYSKS